MILHCFLVASTVACEPVSLPRVEDTICTSSLRKGKEGFVACDGEAVLLSLHDFLDAVIFPPST